MATTNPPNNVERAAVEKNLGKIQTLPDFLKSANELSLDDRDKLIEQALVMVEQFYVHLPLKRAMHAIDPVQRLRLLRLRLAALSERAFHDEMIAIYTHLRDKHTTYILPDPYRSRVAFLPFRIDEFFIKPDKKPHYVVTEVSPLNTDPNLKPGVIPTHWNGVPIDRAVEVNAEREAGSNLDARHAQGLATLTNRWMGMSLPPDEEWVELRYSDLDGKTVREGRFNWQVFEPNAFAGGVDPLGARSDAAAGLGLDVKTEIQRRVKKLLFSTVAVETARQMGAVVKAVGPTPGPAAIPGRAGLEAFTRTAAHARQCAATLDRAAKDAQADVSAQSVLPDAFPKFKAVTSKSGKQFGYIRLVTFDVWDVGQFVDEFIRIAALLPQGGLILDVRGNGGGLIAAGEMLLQLLTPQPIEPASFSFVSSPLTLRLCEKVSSLNSWKASIVQSVQTAAAYSQGFPLTSPELCNSIGQKYRGPVVLITDARCYSTTDIFAAGFQDHGIGIILGTAPRTGAGGANVWTHNFLLQVFPEPNSPFQKIPGNASFSIAIRRSVRAGLQSGVPLEDLGVTANQTHDMTLNDLLEGNVDLIEHACSVLETGTAYTLDAELAAGTAANAAHRVTATTVNLDRVDVLVNGRPRLTLDVSDGPHTFTLPATGGSMVLELRGYRGNTLQASTRLRADAPPPRPAGSPPTTASATPSVSIQALLAVPPADRDVDWIKEGLREAARLEFATIPPYLCGLWSVKNDNDPVYDVIMAVVLQEMLHMGLACNLLVALGEVPQINSKGFVPPYPCELPGGVHPGLIVSLVGLSVPLVRDVWMQIERPLDPVPIAGLTQTFQTIGQFYDALLNCFTQVDPPLDGTHQLTEPMVGLYPVTDLAGVTKALTQIKDQGEGTTQSAFTTPFGDELAHYYRFQQIAEQKLIVKGPDGKAKWGGALTFPAVFNMAEVPKGGWADPEVSRPFNQRFTAMLGLLQNAWADGDKHKLKLAIDVMRALTPLARTLMAKPLSPGNVNFYGPSFLYDPVPPPTP